MEISLQVLKLPSSDCLKLWTLSEAETRFSQPKTWLLSWHPTPHLKLSTVIEPDTIQNCTVWHKLTLLPVGTDPVKLSFETSGWEVRAAPTDPSPATMLNTPAGSPASFSRAARATVERGVYSEHWSCVSDKGTKTYDYLQRWVLLDDDTDMNTALHVYSWPSSQSTKVKILCHETISNLVNKRISTCQSRSNFPASCL